MTFHVSDEILSHRQIDPIIQLDTRNPNKAPKCESN